MVKQFLPLILATGLASCATGKYLNSKGHRLFRDRNYSKAAEEFAKDSQKPSSNQLLFKLDLGMSLFADRKYKEATKVFLEAEKLAEIKDYTSLSEEVGALATSDNVRGYKGEDFEKVLINVYLALAFAANGEIEEAQVEARKINLILYRMIHEGKRKYQESPFARYLSGMLWEMTKDYNSAYVDYKKTFELAPEFPGIGSDLLGQARRLNISEDILKWQTKFPGIQARLIDKTKGELVVIFEAGLSPVKQPRGQDSNLPRFTPRYSDVAFAKIKANGRHVGSTEKVLDIERLSIDYLEDRIGRMTAAKIGGLAVKGAAAYGLAKATKNDDLGLLAFVVLAAVDQADLRSWQTLPRDLQLLRVPLDPGEYSIEVEVAGQSAKTLEVRPVGQYHIKAGSKTFVVVR